VISVAFAKDSITDIIGELCVLGAEVGDHVMCRSLEVYEVGQVLEEDVAGWGKVYCENWKARTSLTSSMYFQAF
jgi:hypothetical protein